MDAAWFFDTLFGLSANAEAMISIWTRPSKRARFFSETDQAASHAVDMGGESDVYFGVGLYKPGITHGRGKAADVVCIPALWADIDYGDQHAKQGTPPDQRAAETILDRVGLRPSIIVHSGHGLHAYWLLTEPSAIESAATLARRWSATVAACARCLNYTVDSVHDLSRVLRVPGTLNHKGDPVPVTVISTEAQAQLRYEPDDSLAMCVDEEYGIAGSDTAVDAIQLPELGAIRLPLKFEIHRENDPKFKKTWEHKRKDLKDGSPSAYDFSLAVQALLAGWPDQDIADLIMAFRVTHGLNPEKARRRDYIQRTIGRAKEEHKSELAAMELGRLDTVPKPPPPPTLKIAAPDAPETTAPAVAAPPADSSREHVLALLSKALRVPVARWIQHSRDDATFNLILQDGTDILIGSVSSAMSWAKFKEKLYEVTGTVLPRFKGPRWDNICKQLAVIREVEENPEAGRVNILRDWLTAYLPMAAARNALTPEALEGNLPLRKDGVLHVHTGHLLLHVRQHCDNRITRPDLWPYFHAAGFKNVQLAARRRGESNVQRRYWRDDRGLMALGQGTLAGEGVTG